MADVDSGGDKNFTCVIMKTNCWLILGMMVATGAFAQTATNVPPPMTPAPDASVSIMPPPEIKTNAPAKKAPPAKKKILSSPAPKKITFTEPLVALLPGAAEVAVSNLNVRGQVGLKGEVVAHLNKGDAVTVLSQINLDKHAAGEPAQWAKIALPASTKIWVHTTFIDATNKTVLPKKLNLRAGPGENYSVMGVIEHGTVVNAITTKDAWTQIEPPTNAYAFVAAMYLKQAASGTLAKNPAPSTETAPVPVSTPVVETPPVVTGPAANAPAAPQTNSPAPTIPSPTPVVAANLPPPPPRVVTHEGVVGHVDSIIAPTKYVLYSLDTHQEINFLYTTATNLDISRYVNMHIIVTGEEGMAVRWHETPVLTIQRIVVVATNVVPKVYLPAPRQRN
jgi:uncharacterized protein YgiM (DUF1202 family)